MPTQLTFVLGNSVVTLLSFLLIVGGVGTIPRDGNAFGSSDFGVQVFVAVWGFVPIILLFLAVKRQSKEVCDWTIYNALVVIPCVIVAGHDIEIKENSCDLSTIDSDKCKQGYGAVVAGCVFYFIALWVDVMLATLVQRGISRLESVPSASNYQANAAKADELGHGMTNIHTAQIP